LCAGMPLLAKSRASAPSQDAALVGVIADFCSVSLFQEVRRWQQP
jgi:hypothetical protein